MKRLIAVVALAALVVTAAAFARSSATPPTRADRHTARFPDGVDLKSKDDTSDLLLRGEWEDSAVRTAEQLGGWTIAISIAAILLTFARRGRRAPVPPPPPEIAGHPPGSVG